MSSEESDISSEDKSSRSFNEANSFLDAISCNSDVSFHFDISEDYCLSENKDILRDSDKLSASSCMSLSSISSGGSAHSNSVPVSEEYHKSHVVLPDVLPQKTILPTNSPLVNNLNSDLKENGFHSLLRRCNECGDNLRKHNLVKKRKNLNIEQIRSTGALFCPPEETKEKIIRVSANYQRCDKMKDVETWMVDNKYNAKNGYFSNLRSLDAESAGVLNFTMIHNFEVLNIEDYVQSENRTILESGSHTLKKNGVLSSTRDEISFKDSHTDSTIIRKNKEKLSPSWNMTSLVRKEQHSSQGEMLKTENSAVNKEPEARVRNTNPSLLEKKEENGCVLVKSCSNVHSNIQKNFQLEATKCSCSRKKENECNEVNENFSTNNASSAVTLRKKNLSTDANSKKKFDDRKFSTTDQFEIYTMDSSLLHGNKCNKETEWIRKRRNDREEIRRRLAMDYDSSDFASEKVNQNRYSHSSLDKLKSSNNLQICFVNEMFKDKDLQKSDNVKKSDRQRKLSDTAPMSKRFSLPIPSSTVLINEKGSSLLQNNNNRRQTVVKRPKTNFIFNRPHSWGSWKTEQKFNPEDFLNAHLKLQTEARAALAQAKDMARMQMELERQKKKKSPIADIVGLPFPDGKFLLSHNALVDLNVAQLQVIVNDLHSQIENLNEDLVKILLERDDLHMEQDSMLVDIEDLTRYLGLKGNSCSSLSTNS